MVKLSAALRPYAVLICAALFIVMVGAGLIYFAPFPSASADFASWVQAVGTVVALFVAIGIPLWQVERQRQERIEQRQAVHGVAKRLGEVVVVTLQDIAQLVPVPIDWARASLPTHIALIERLSLSLAGFPLHSLSADAALTMVHIQGHLATAELILRGVSHGAADEEACLAAASRLWVLVNELAERLPDLDP